jgi:hypothetical protein
LVNIPVDNSRSKMPTMGLEETTMSLTPKRRMTEKNLAAHRTNAKHSRGAVTPAGKRRAARTNLRHGFYAEMSPEVLDALGEDAADYARLAIHDELQPEGALKPSWPISGSRSEMGKCTPKIKKLQLLRMSCRKQRYLQNAKRLIRMIYRK